MAKSLFSLWKTKGGRVLITTEEHLRPETLDQVTLAFDTWAKGPEGSVLLIPDCAYEGELEDGTITVVKAQARAAFETKSPDEILQSVAGEKPEATALPVDAVGFSADALAERLEDRATSPAEIAQSHGWDIADVLKAFRGDPRFEETGPGSGRWQLTDDAFRALDQNRSKP
jgi:hypothetical protein